MNFEPKMFERVALTNYHNTIMALEPPEAQKISSWPMNHGATLRVRNITMENSELEV